MEVEAEQAVKISAIPVRRVVTVNDENGRSRIEEDRYSPYVTQIGDVVGHAVTDLWMTGSMPARPNLPDPCSATPQLAPPKGGTVFRVVQFPPEAEWLGIAETGGAFASMGESGATALQGVGAPHPFMHTTQSIDYAIVLKGEIWAVMDEGEVLLKAGDVLGGVDKFEPVSGGGDMNHA